MAHRMTRRNALTVGAAAGMAFGKSGGAHAAVNPSNEIGRSPFWEPGPDKNLKRDLTPGKTPIRLGGSLRYDTAKGIGESVRALRQAGYTGCVTGPAPWDAMSDSQVSELRAALKQHDVVIFEVGGYTNMIHPDMSVRRENLKKLAHCIETADRIGCPMVGTISGSLDPVNFFNVHPENWTEATWKMLVESCRQVLRDTSGMKAAIGMEAQVTTNIDGPKSHRRLIDDVGDARLAVNLDPVNMVSFERYFHTTELITECFDLLGETILGCHAKDSYVIPDQQTVLVQEVCAGRGVMDYETYLVRLSA
jgi:sugar phosphate isomerase/epimerase